jgi:hypothetical protein
MKAICTLFALLATNLAALAELDLGNRSSYTPYDRYLSPVRTVLGALGKDKPTMEQVKSLMRQGRAFRYKMDDPYRPAMPSETAQTREGDCKDKSLWLCDQLNDPSVRFVIGKTKRGVAMSHAWVMWECEGRWWILDCTLKRDPFPADSVSKDRYVPLYSYSRAGSYRHADTVMNLAAVASSKQKAPVASR